MLILAVVKKKHSLENRKNGIMQILCIIFFTQKTIRLLEDFTLPLKIKNKCIQRAIWLYEQ